MSVSFPLEARAVTKRYGRPFGRKTTALANVELSIPAGSITALVGPNGAGKTTLIKGWTGFERPSHGQLLVDGIDPQRNRGAAIRRVGYVPQAASLYRSLTVAEHLAMARSLRPGFDAAVARHRLDELGIPADRRAGELSGGQQAQVGLAIALGTRAQVLLLDEPLASLDPLARREFLGILVDSVRRNGATALLSSHVITDVEAACGRLIVLGGGRVLLHDSLAAAVADHRVAAGGTAEGRVVAIFPGPAGEPLTLYRVDPGAVVAGGADPTGADAAAPDATAGGASGRPATLDEVVLGYLAAGRRTPPEFAAATIAAAVIEGAN